ncbi:MAG: FkbM family methyltransferase [Saprospiraceae bacterium]|jgi:FkbM family methyltransferase|nr:FkbM family methyltransferase [Saprospiraceae bacterium]
MISRYIYPYRLREKITARLGRYFDRQPSAEQEVRLTFAPGCVMRLQPGDVGHDSIRMNGFYELVLSRQITRLGKSGGMLVDAGANYGYFSLLWLAQNNQNRCIAFEPAPDNLKPLSYNINRNNLSGRMSVVTDALSNQTGTVPFALENTGGQTGWGGIARQNDSATIHVPAVTLDDYWAGHFPDSSISVLKIDVEGADTLVLQGARKLLEAQRIGHVFFEVNPPRMERLGILPHQAPELLAACGYRMEQIAPNEFHAYL